MIIRDEQPADISAIRTLVTEAFRTMPYSDQTEGAIVEGLRNAGALAISLVANDEGDVAGYIAVSPVTIGGADLGWYGLGPVAVRPDMQGRGIGQALVRAGLQRLRALGANGAVLLGAPAFYGRFGFRARAELRLAGAPPAHFLALSLGGEMPSGLVEYHAAFASKG